MAEPTITSEQINAIFEHIDKFNIVRVFKKNDILNAIRIAVLNGIEQDYGQEYEIIVMEGELPAEGDYPLSDFEEIITAANVYPIDYIGEIKPNSNISTLLYRGNEEEL